MKLYTYPGAPHPRRVHIYLAEKGIEIPFERVDIMTRENKSPAFIEEVNAMGAVPALELDDGSHIAESIAICRYLEALYPEPSMFGSTPEEIGVVDMWLRRIELYLMMPVGMVWVHGSPLTKAVVKEQIPSVAELNREMVNKYFEFLDRRLAQSEYLAGSNYSMADITALCTMDFAATLNDLPHKKGQVHLSRWYESVSGRASAKEQ
jgi:glutathione S-transferase